MVEDPNAIPPAPPSVVDVLLLIEKRLKRIADALETQTPPSPASMQKYPGEPDAPQDLSQVTVPIVRGLFNDKQQDLLVVSDEDEFVKVKSKEYLIPETFKKIARIVEDHGGEYISAGKESHFRFLKKGST